MKNKLVVWQWLVYIEGRDEVCWAQMQAPAE
jgi:hypothetical protein